MASTADAAIYRLFSDMLTYPTPALSRQVLSGQTVPCAGQRPCYEAGDAVAHEALTRSYPAAATALVPFRAFVAAGPSSRLEELYTATFDLQPACCPYVGYLLHGEGYQRGAFLVHLKECYRAAGFTPEAFFGNELPDHFAVILRFLAHLAAQGDECPAPQVEDEFVKALGRALAQMRAALDAANPYAGVLVALSMVLGGETGATQLGVASGRVESQ